MFYERTETSVSATGLEVKISYCSHLVNYFAGGFTIDPFSQDSIRTINNYLC
jgi:hypothetical protein